MTKGDVMNKKLLLITTVLLGLSSAMALADEMLGKQYLPVDSDSDAVVDDKDECYKTEAGAAVDEIGCYLVVKDLKQMQLKINFAFDSSVVEPEYFSEVKKVADFLNANPLSRVTIEGHTDSDGSDQYNKRLSQRRAQAVAKVLVTEFDIKPIRVTAVGFGESRPLVANDSDANKFKNRRVVAALRSLKEKRG
jgi:OOP family OmpA-OmpF porin